MKDSAAVQLKPIYVSEDGGEGHKEDQTFTAEIVDKHDVEEREPLKSEALGSGEGKPTSTDGQQAEETIATVQSKVYEPSLWLAICRTFCKPFTVGAFFKLGHDVLLFVSPLLLKYVFAVTLSSLLKCSVALCVDILVVFFIYLQDLTLALLSVLVVCAVV